MIENQVGMLITGFLCLILGFIIGRVSENKYKKTKKQLIDEE